MAKMLNILSRDTSINSDATRCLLPDFVCRIVRGLFWLKSSYSLALLFRCPVPDSSLPAHIDFVLATIDFSAFNACWQGGESCRVSAHFLVVVPKQCRKLRYREAKRLPRASLHWQPPPFCSVMEQTYYICNVQYIQQSFVNF